MKRIVVLLMSLIVSNYCFGAYNQRPREFAIQRALHNEESRESALNALKRAYNFHTVKEGVVYRSGYLPSCWLKEVVGWYEIKAVLNLSEEFKEAKVCKESGVIVFNVPIDSYGLIAEGHVRNLLSIFANFASFPMLIFGGIGSTGFAAALYQLVNEEPLEEALRQFAPKFGGVGGDPKKVFLIRLAAEKGLEWLKNEYLAQDHVRDSVRYSKRYRADRSCCECLCCCCECFYFCCDCCDCLAGQSNHNNEPGCCSSRSLEIQFGKLNLCCK